MLWLTLKMEELGLDSMSKRGICLHLRWRSFLMNTSLDGCVNYSCLCTQCRYRIDNVRSPKCPECDYSVLQSSSEFFVKPSNLEWLTLFSFVVTLLVGTASLLWAFSSYPEYSGAGTKRMIVFRIESFSGVAVSAVAATLIAMKIAIKNHRTNIFNSILLACGVLSTIVSAWWAIRLIYFW